MSKNFWCISDTHFWHENILKWGRGQFNNVEEMNEHIVQQWNSVVKPGDHVYHLGDVFFGGKTAQEEKALLARMHGKKRLIIGNHDRVVHLAQYNHFEKMMLWRHFHDFGLIMTHVPMHEDSIIERAGEKAINVHGHTHLQGSPKGPYKSVCCELVNYTPVNLEEIRDSFN